MIALLHSRQRDLWLLIAIFLLEAVLAHTYFIREIAWHQPENYDQTGLLLESYRLEQDILRHSFGAVIDYLSQEHASGLALPVEGTLSGLLLGGTRLPRLVVNFVFFVLVQLAAFQTGRKVWGRSAYGYAALGLLLCENTIWLPAGGLFDFRLDHAAWCLYGIWVCLAIASDGLLQRRLACGCWLIAIALILHRFVAAAYVVGGYAGWALCCALAALMLKGHAVEASKRLWRRAGRAALSLLALLLALGPLFYAERDAIGFYYVAGHLSGDEPLVRAREQGIVTLLDHLTYYPTSLVTMHLGWVFVLGAAILLGAALLGWRRQRAPIRSATPLGFLLLSIALPLAVLTIDVSKSPVVIGILGVPMALMMVALWVRLGAPNRRLVPVAAAAVLLLGGLHGFARASRHSPEYADRQDLQRITELDEWLVQEAAAQNWRKPLLSADVMAPWFNADAVAATGYEHGGELVDLRMALGGRLRAIDRDEALDLVRRSQVLVLTAHAGAGLFPFDHSIAAMLPELRAYADQHMVLVRTLRLRDNELRVYFDPEAAAARTVPR